MAIANDTNGPARQKEDARLRDKSKEDDHQLDVNGMRLMAIIPERLRPVELARRFPRIVNQAAKLWTQPAEMKAYFRQLLFNQRANRFGFPFAVLMELMALQDFYLKKLPKEDNVWNNLMEVDREE
jgi:hypothetical protein